ncbi:PREDICTED: uncharacterized protein LOC109584587 [Amphimedon queenslandica]|uniref:BEN domain-containing protein n=1 Tax=Amphimedon queenslandica TaxID=400682 RepID=A0A1X7U6F7_AMPQE|nr:PREDICTED: uncharacterized protein LOC109584587 [Amphimedon queenslandica]|eukprot:XP_019855935.1 PREDICTED: uncharacterized protein LOC109584587 [Amphimedon queenslandica]
MKNEDELEFLEIPCDGRTSFLLGDKINTEWDDGEMYEAEIVDVGPKSILQGRMRQHRQKNDQGKKKSDLAHERKKKQAADIIDSIIDKNDSIEDIFSQTTAKDYDIFPDSPNPAEHNISITAENNGETSTPKGSQPETQKLDSSVEFETPPKKMRILSDEQELEKWIEKYRKLKTKYRELKKKRMATDTSIEEKPKPGLVKKEIAEQFEMIEIIPSSKVYWTEVHKQLVLSKTSSASQLANACVDVFFDKNILSLSNTKGGGTGKYKPLNEDILNGIRAFVQKNYPGTKLSVINTVINNKCTSARRCISSKENKDTE